MALNQHAPQCTAKAKKTGQRCKNPAVSGVNVCRLHGGTGVRHGGDNPNFKHGRYSKVVRGTIAARLADVDDSNPLDLLDELKIQRALFADYASRFIEGVALKAEDIQRLMDWSSDIGRMVERVAKMRNDTALTTAEVQYLQTRIVDVVMKYFDDPDKRKAFLTELFGTEPEPIRQRSLVETT